MMLSNKSKSRIEASLGAKSNDKCLRVQTFSVMQNSAVSVWLNYRRGPTYS